MVVNLDAFSRTASLQRTGELTVSGQSLRNEGTVGNMIANFFRSLGEALGLIKPDPARAQRQQVAYNAFKEALSTKFGDNIANNVMVTIGTNRPLTGARALEGIRHAQVERLQNMTRNECLLFSAMPVLPGDTYIVPKGKNGEPIPGMLRDNGTYTSPIVGKNPNAYISIPSHFDQLARQANVNPALFGGNALLLNSPMTVLYKEKLEQAIWTQSKGGRVDLSLFKVDDLALATLKSMRGLGSDIEASKVLSERQKLVDGATDLINFIKDNPVGSTPDPTRAHELAKKFDVLKDQAVVVVKAMNIKEAGGDDIVEEYTSAITTALKQQSTGSGFDKVVKNDPDINALIKEGDDFRHKPVLDTSSDQHMAQLAIAIQASLMEVAHMNSTVD